MSKVWSQLAVDVTHVMMYPYLLLSMLPCTLQLDTICLMNQHMK